MCVEKNKAMQILDLHGLFIFKSDPGENRTHDPMIKSHLLYQLSYGVFFSGVAKVKIFISQIQVARTFLYFLSGGDLFLFYSIFLVF